MKEKMCSCCRDWKGLSKFHKNKSAKDGHQNRCKSCRIKYHEANKEHIAKRTREYYEADPAKAAGRYQRTKNWRLANPDKQAAQRKRHFEAKKANQQQEFPPDNANP